MRVYYIHIRYFDVAATDYIAMRFIEWSSLLLTQYCWAPLAPYNIAIIYAIAASHADAAYVSHYVIDYCHYDIKRYWLRQYIIATLLFSCRWMIWWAMFITDYCCHWYAVTLYYAIVTIDIANTPYWYGHMLLRHFSYYVIVDIALLIFRCWSITPLR